MRTFLLSLFSVFLFTAQSQITFERTYGGNGSFKGLTLWQNADSGFVIGGWQQNFVPPDAYILRTNKYGDTLWTKTIGGINWDEITSIRQTMNGNFIATGNSNNSSPSSGAVYLILLNPYGNILWSKNFQNGNNCGGSCVQPTIDSGFIIAGYRDTSGMAVSDIYLIKTNSLGDTLWTKTFGGQNSDFGHSVQQTSDSGYIIVGSTNSFGAGSGDVYLIKTDANGDLLWTQTIGGVNYESGREVHQTFDGGYIIVGTTSSFGTGMSDVYLIKTNSNGDTLWTKTYGGTNYDFGYSLQQTIDGGFVIAGWTENSSRDVFLIKTNFNGDSLWAKTFGDALKTDEAYSIQLCNDGGYIITGVSANNNIYLIKTDSLGNVYTGINEKENSEQKISIFPNPNNGKFGIRSSEFGGLKIYNILGNEVYSQTINNQQSTLLNLNLPPGIYFLKIGNAVSKFSIVD